MVSFQNFRCLFRNLSSAPLFRHLNMYKEYMCEQMKSFHLIVTNNNVPKVRLHSKWTKWTTSFSLLLLFSLVGFRSRGSFAHLVAAIGGPTRINETSEWRLIRNASGCCSWVRLLSRGRVTALASLNGNSTKTSPDISRIPDFPIQSETDSSIDTFGAGNVKLCA